MNGKGYLKTERSEVSAKLKHGFNEVKPACARTAHILLLLNAMNIMKNYSISSITVILISGLLSACSMSDWWNGHYATRAALTDAYNERVAYYAAESPEQQELRRKNRLICDKETGYDRCMRRLGTPVWHDGLDK